jgi:hypothetical protein
MSRYQVSVQETAAKMGIPKQRYRVNLAIKGEYCDLHMLLEASRIFDVSIDSLLAKHEHVNYKEPLPAFERFTYDPEDETPIYERPFYVRSKKPDTLKQRSKRRQARQLESPSISRMARKAK